MHSIRTDLNGVMRREAGSTAAKRVDLFTLPLATMEKFDEFEIWLKDAENMKSMVNVIASNLLSYKVVIKLIYVTFVFIFRSVNC